MTVGELIDILKQLPKDLQVVDITDSSVDEAFETVIDDDTSVVKIM